MTADPEGWRQMRAEDDVGVEGLQGVHAVGVCLPPDAVNPWAIDGRPDQQRSQQFIGRQLAHVRTAGESGSRHRPTEAVRAEAGAAPIVVEAHSGRAVEQRWTEGGQGSVADVQALAGVEEVDPVQGNGRSVDMIPTPRTW